jgi:uncharacterized protein (DUF2126 family)/transglutaminase-like putative cysteine protease
LRLLLQHHSSYAYPRAAALGPHLIRLRPATHTKASIETYSLRVPEDGQIHWQQDPSGNRVARLTFLDGVRIDRLDIAVEMAVDIRPVNPFDFFLDDSAQTTPFAYPTEMRHDLLPFFAVDDPAMKGGPLLDAFLAELPSEGPTVPLIIECNRLVNERTRYVIREEAGIWTPEQTLAEGRGSCRDSAVLLIAALRSRGFAARFVSGYLIQLVDEGMIPDAPKGVGRDVVDLHAWAEVFLPGAGWIGLDATSGLLCGEGHIPLACTAFPALASPLEGTSDVPAGDVTFSMTIGRLGHEPRPTTPYEEPVWQALKDAGARADERLAAQKLTLTMGGEPTFNSRDHAALPEWNEAALGATKWAQGLTLVSELKKRLAPGAAVIHRAGKLYPGESLPRWALEICGAKDGSALWNDLALPTADRPTVTPAQVKILAEAIARELDLEGFLQPAFEDPWRFLQEEASLPVDVDPLHADLDDPEERRRLARVLDRGLGRETGFVLPLVRAADRWVSERWSFRRGHLFLVPGDSPIGLRLPLRSLSPAELPQIVEEPVSPPDPRRGPADEEPQQNIPTAGRPHDAHAHIAAGGAVKVRTALSVELRDGAVHVFLPPLTTAADFFALVRAVDRARRHTGLDAQLEGYPPPSSPEIFRFAVTPDPGVLEVNIPPVADTAAYVTLMEAVFDAALHAGLHCEKYLVDGRMAGSGGGNHIALGGPTPQQSPFLQRPDLLGSLITFVQHHPSLSYMFTGLFVGPTSQAPRVDEARHDTLYELEIALRRAFDTRTESERPAPWLSDLLFRHLLVDLSGNTHRSEICIDKLFSPEGAHGRQGVVELRAFEMPPHVRMAVAQMILVRTLITAFAEKPYQAPLSRLGAMLHDRYLLPYWMWRDFEEILAFLDSRGLALPAEAYRPFVDLRCPVVGTLAAGDVTLELRNAIEPWNVLGEEMSSSGTSRYVDSSVERIEIRTEGFLPDRHAVLVNGHALPLRPTGVAGRHVGGVRFRAWAPPHSLHAHIGVHHPVRLDVVDLWGQRSLGACGYHVWHPQGRAYDTPPLTRFEAAARRAQRFTLEAAIPWPVMPIPAAPHPEQPYTLDLRRYSGDRRPPEPIPEQGEDGSRNAPAPDHPYTTRIG